MANGETPAAARTGRSLLVLAGFLALCLGIGALGSLATAESVGDWYQGLRKPGFTPPDWLFGPVWTLLYILIGIAGWLVWRRAGLRRARWAFAAYLLQLCLNLGWSVLFFGLQQVAWAMADLLALLAAIAATAWLFRRHDDRAALLLLPYLAWTGYAALLNAGIWWLNGAAP